MITIEQLKVLPPETEIVVTKPEDTQPEDGIHWISQLDGLTKVKVTVADLNLAQDSYPYVATKFTIGYNLLLDTEWLSLKEEDGLGRLRRTISALRSKKRAKYKTEHDYNRLRQITQTKYDRIKYRARCEGADTVSNDNQFMYNGFLYQQDYSTLNWDAEGVSYIKGYCCMRTRLPKVKLKDVLTRSADTAKGTTLEEDRKSTISFPKITMPSLKGVDAKLISKLSERINSFTIEDASEGDAVKSDKISKNWTASHYDNNYTLTEDDIEKGFVRVDAYFVNRMWKINSWDDTGAAFHNLKTLTRIGNNKNTLKRELIALAKQTKALCKLHGVTDEDLL